jgi:hypothetical protein
MTSFATAAPYACPAPVSTSVAGCTFVSQGGTTTYMARMSFQAMGNLEHGFSLMGLQVNLDSIPCFDDTFDPVLLGNPADVKFVTAENINATCVFEVTSKRPVELLAHGMFVNATPNYIALTATSIDFVPDLHLDVSMVGQGTITSSDGAIDCGADCAETYKSATTLTLTATPAAGYAFTNWSGDCAGIAPSCILRVSEIRKVTANFSRADPAPVVEFHNIVSDHYFITADPAEAAAIDSGGAGAGWSRTGYSFKSSGNTPVCRFYGSVSPGPNSHFYTALASECNTLKSLQANIPATAPRWNYEGLAFASTLPVDGLCPSWAVPVYRAYNNGFARGIDSNHRITSSAAGIAEVVARGWRDEGTVMCAPE